MGGHPSCLIGQRLSLLCIRSKKWPYLFSPDINLPWPAERRRRATGNEEKHEQKPFCFFCVFCFLPTSAPLARYGWTFRISSSDEANPEELTTAGSESFVWRRLMKTTASRTTENETPSVIPSKKYPWRDAGKLEANDQETLKLKLGRSLRRQIYQTDSDHPRKVTLDWARIDTSITKGNLWPLSVFEVPIITITI
jgi:hypothetical protein